ncbi:MAG: tRNA epoxyqueuosine(34) reductase QueG [Pseudomonadota bacterium]
MTPFATAQEIKSHALELGFDAAAIAPPRLPDEFVERLADFVRQGRHGEMAWMADRLIQRSSPDALWPDTKSVVMVAMNYGPDTDPLVRLNEKKSGVISVYAQNKDYHDVLKKRLKQLARRTVEKFGCEVKVFVDTAPVMEKPLAGLAGLGWQGKHTNLVSRTHGSWLFLGAMFTTLDLPADVPESDHCGQCSACLDICPTDAFPGPYQLDARRCISYLTIEHAGPIPIEFRKAMGNRIYGCDDCLAVCPWNKFASRANEIAFHAREDLKSPSLAELAHLNDTEFRRRFSGSPVKRIKRNRFVRNVLIAIGNSGASELVETVLARLNDEAPIVRGAAVWALAQIAPADQVKEVAKRYAGREQDPTVKEEWGYAVQEGVARSPAGQRSSDT